MRVQQTPSWAVTPVWAAPRPGFALDRRVSRVSARLGDISMVGTAHAGTCFLLRSLRGWWAGGTPRGGGVDNEYGDGGFRGDVFMGPRVVTIQGMILTETGAAQMDAFDQLAAVWGQDRWQTLSVTEGERGLTRELDVAPRDTPEPTPLSDVAATFTLTMRSESYPLLAPVETVRIPLGGSAAVINRGNYPTVPEAMFHGPLPTPRLRFGGATPGTWRYLANINQGQRLQVDFDKRIMRNPDTQGHSRIYGAGDWPVLAPGQTTFHLEGTGSGYVDLSWRSAWN